jgi:hypothetical protein
VKTAAALIDASEAVRIVALREWLMTPERLDRRGEMILGARSSHPLSSCRAAVKLAIIDFPIFRACHRPELVESRR